MSTNNFTLLALLTFDCEEAGRFEVFGVAGVGLGVVQGAILDDQRSLAALGQDFVLLRLADLLVVPEPLDLSVCSGNFTLERGGGFLLHCLVLQRFGELYRRLWMRKHKEQRFSFHLPTSGILHAGLVLYPTVKFKNFSSFLTVSFGVFSPATQYKLIKNKVSINYSVTVTVLSNVVTVLDIPPRDKLN